MEENNYIQGVLDSRSQGDVWIGYFDSDGDHAYIWTDKTCSSFENWADGEPNNSGDEDCTMFYPNGRWNDINCNNNYGYVCRNF